MVKRLSHKEVETRYKNKNLVLLEKYQGNRIALKTKCKCGQIFTILPSTVFLNNSIKQCQICQLENNRANLVGNRYGRLIVKSYFETDTKEIRWWCQCDCGVELSIRGHSLTSGITKSCGCYRVDKVSEITRINLINQKFGKLIVVKFSNINKWNEQVWLCNCVCGKFHKVVGSELRRGVVKSCGNCLTFRNGKRASYPQIWLHNQLGGIINFKSNNKYIDIALVRNKVKIAIEYNEWYWHGDKIQQDELRAKELIDNGWKVIMINAKNNLPDIGYVKYLINSVDNWKTSINRIYLKNWGSGKIFNREKNKI